MSCDSLGKDCLIIQMVVIKVILQIHFFSLFFKYGTCSNSTQCNPAEEGTPHSITFCLDTNNTGLLFNIDNENTPIAECSLRKEHCSQRVSMKASSILVKKDTNYYHLLVTMQNVTRDNFGMEGIWFLTNAESSTEAFMSCRLYIYAKPSDVTCDRSIEYKTLHVKCLTERVYPKLKCVFLTQDIEMKETVSKLDVTYTNIKGTGMSFYYRSSCAIYLELKIERKETFDITVTMYPDVTGNNSDIIYGTNETIKLDLEQQGVTIEDCPKDIKLGDRVTCRCVALGYSNTNNSALWFNENQVENITSSNILHFNVTQNVKNYNFVCKLLAGNINATAFYRPHIYDSTVDDSLCASGCQFHYIWYIIIAILAILLVFFVTYGCKKGFREKVNQNFHNCTIINMFQTCFNVFSVNRTNEQPSIINTNDLTRNNESGDIIEIPMDDLEDRNRHLINNANISLSDIIHCSNERKEPKVRYSRQDRVKDEAANKSILDKK